MNSLPIDLDPDIADVILIFNEIEGVETSSSCYGHPRGAHIYFSSKDMPDWLNDIMIYVARNTKKCLGCYRIEWGYKSYLDCAHTLSGYWYLEINPRKDMHVTCEGMDEIWSLIKDGLEKLVNGDLNDRMEPTPRL